MALFVLGVLVCAALVMLPLRRATLKLGSILGPFATPAVPIAAVLCFAASATVLVAIRAPSLFEAYPPLKLSWIPGAAVVYLGVARIARRAAGSWRASRHHLLAVTALLTSAFGLFLCQATFGSRSNPRNMLARDTIAGQRLIRWYLQATDRDGDGFSSTFGGGDCDDSNPQIYPGAPDEPGDGIDADCFDGDGGRDVGQFGNGNYAEVPAEVPQRPNILFVMVDTLRPDHLGTHGYARNTSPNIDAFAETAIRFEGAVASSSRSLRSIPSVFTGLYPSQIEYGDEYIWPALLPENATLAEMLSDAGYFTSANLGTDYFARMRGFFQGFKRHHQEPQFRPRREQVFRSAMRELERLSRRAEPWFHWIHIFNVHGEYLSYGTPSRFGEKPVDKYDTEIYLADQIFGKILKRLDELDESQNTIVVLCSDHGEAFGEHDNRGHSFTVYEEEIRAVLMIRVPGLSPRVVRGAVPLFDLFPTLLNLLRIPLPREVPARSLLPYLIGQANPPANRLIFSEILPDGMFPFDQKALRRGRWKLILWTREHRMQLFDLARDPQEQHNLADAETEIRDELLGLSRAWIAQTARPQNSFRQVVQSNRLDAEPEALTHRLNYRYPGRFTVLGYDMNSTRVRVGDTLDMTFYYRVDGEMQRDFLFFVDLVGPPGYRVPPHTHARHHPMNGHYKTSQWVPGEILRDSIRVTIPQGMRPSKELKIRFAVLDEKFKPLRFETSQGSETLVELVPIEVHR